MTNRETTGLVHTVLGPVRPEALGPTLTHEHLLIDFLCMFDPPDDPDGRLKAFQPLTLENLGWIRYDPFRNRDNLLRLDEESAISEIALFQQAGGGTIVDVTTIGIGRSPEALVRIAQDHRAKHRDGRRLLHRCRSPRGYDRAERGGPGR